MCEVSLDDAEKQVPKEGKCEKRDETSIVNCKKHEEATSKLTQDDKDVLGETIAVSNEEELDKIAIIAARGAYTLALEIALTGKSNMTLVSGINSLFYAAEIIPVVGGMVSGGSDGILTVRAGRKAKRAFLRLEAHESIEEDPAVLLEAETDIHPTVAQISEMDHTDDRGRMSDLTVQAVGIVAVATEFAAENAYTVAAEVNTRAKEARELGGEVMSSWWNRAAGWAEEVMKSTAESLHGNEPSTSIYGGGESNVENIVDEIFGPPH